MQHNLENLTIHLNQLYTGTPITPMQIKLIGGLRFDHNATRLDIINEIDTALKAAVDTNQTISKIEIEELDKVTFRLIFSSETKTMKDPKKNKIPSLTDLLKELSDAGLPHEGKLSVFPLNMDDTQSTEDSTLLELDIISTAVDIIQRIENTPTNPINPTSALTKYIAAIEKKYIASYLN